MTPGRRAVIDVGTNSVKLLVAEVQQGKVRPLLEESHQTRLGRGFYSTQTLQAGPIAQTAQSVASFAGKARECGAHSIRVIATSAARDAKNKDELLLAIEKASGFKTRILTGDEEANYGFKGVTTDIELATKPLLLLDVGGGSTEFILGQGHEPHFAHSFNVGTVRLLERLPVSDPPKVNELSECRAILASLLESEIGPKLAPALKQEDGRRKPGVAMQLVGIGGTASILACMEAKLTGFDRETLEATRLSVARLSWHVDTLWGMPLGKRKTVIGLPPNRADVILTGVAIYEAVMGFFKFEELRVSTRGLRFALALEE